VIGVVVWPIALGVSFVGVIVVFIVGAAFHVAKHGMPDSYFGINNEPASQDPLRGDLVWTCHFCGDRRIDADIAVAETQRTLGRIPVTLTRRYCRDKPECRTAAVRWTTDTDVYGNVPT
jgi:hypothetical protein